MDTTGRTRTAQVHQQVRPGPEASRSESRWRSYSRRRWKQQSSLLTGVHLEARYTGLAEEDETDTTTKLQKHLDKKLLDHFRHLAASNQDTDQVDLQFLDEVISGGADPNCSDRYGQTVLHEVSRAWSVDVMRFFLDRGSDPLGSDRFGVTALHVASALDYEDMVQFLLDREADPSARTLLDQQTPLHYAAKNDAVRSIKLLLRAGAAISCTDYKQRTPLQLAASMERSEAAQVLLELGASAGVKDSDGQMCISALIGRMSHVAQEALRQFHVMDRVTRQEYFYLNLLEPEAGTPGDPSGAGISEPTTPLQVVVLEGKLDLIMNPVFLKLIEIKWKLYGRLGAWILLVLNFLLNVCWTTVAISMSVCQDSPDRYTFPQDWWRVLLVVLALLLTLEEVFREIQDIVLSRRKLHLRRRWMERRFQDDLRCSHPMWPQERQYLLNQTRRIHRMRGNYSRDRWLMGPFIVMLGNIVGDVMCFLFLYAEIFIPYACSFWIIFGGTPSVPSMQSVSGLLYSLYRITLVDEYEYAAMVTVDNIMAPLLCGTFLAASSILCINLLIALLTDTFQRVHDNSQANAVMQQAAVILQVEDSMPRLHHFYDNQYISKHCSPLGEACDTVSVSSCYHHEFGQVTGQVRETLDQFLVLQRDMEAASRSRFPTEQHQQNQQLQVQENHELQNLPIQESQTAQKQKLQGPKKHHNQSQESLERQNQQVQDPKNLQQELQAVQAELKELRSLVQQLVQIRNDFV
ncbi:transient receptor potential cation channel subfamily A member 1 isoform X4 [Xiphophorus hellerii]|uniref:transient receptor potential cation channel subfamily A member 1 isoform X4 n=1 Tax=Xiphophorus hellerii TaxID=8084 RepID=UPI0013B40B94|nr:transient receptor potential cation channel subfamily A member 1-like isoform X4 [Xiphophorus hellerii]